MLKNEKGSILSVAIIVIVLLSFSMTTVTAYTANVARRTNTTVELKSDEGYIRAIIDAAIQDFRDGFETQATSYNTFEELDQQTSIIQVLIEDIEADYPGIGITETETADDLVTRIYRFSYTLSDSSVRYKDLYTTLDQGESSQDTDYSQAIFEGEDSLLQTWRDELDLDGDDKEFSNPEDLVEELFSPPGQGNSKVIRYKFDGSFYLDSDELIIDADDSPGSSDKIEMFSKRLLIEGNLTFSNISTLIGAEDGDPEGVILVTGSLTIDTDKDLQLKNILIIVQEGATINLNGQKLNGSSNYMIISLNSFSTNNCSSGCPAIETVSLQASNEYAYFFTDKDLDVASSDSVSNFLFDTYDIDLQFEASGEFSFHESEFE